MARMSIGERLIVVERGDITRVRTDAIVTAANAGLRGGGGVDGAVHRTAGPELLAACRALGDCPTGSAVLTAAFRLEAQGIRHVIHAVGPRWRGGGAGEADLLRGAYGRSLELAEEAGCASISFPSISTGVYGFPAARAAPIAVATARRFLAEGAAALTQIVFVLFDAETLGHFDSAIAGLE